MAKQDDDARFVELLTSSQIGLRAFALSMIRIPADADDVLQNACVALWEKRRKYDHERDFFPWACGVVLVEVLRYRKKSARDKHLFDEVLLNSLATDFVRHRDQLDRRRELLHDCVGDLNGEDRTLLTDRYGLGMKPKELAANRRRPPTTIYSALARVRETLYRCVEAKLASDSHPRG